MSRAHTPRRSPRPIHPRRKLAALAFAAAAGLAASPAHATTFTYSDASSGGNWSTAANWNPNSAAPFVGDTALFHTNAASPFTLNYDYNISGNGLTALNIDPFGPGNLIFSQTGGGTILIAVNEVVGDNNDGAAFAIYSHSGGLNAPGTLTVALSSGANGIYNLSGSGIVNVSGNLYVGSNTGSVGTFNMSAGSLTVGGLATIGNAGNGTFNQTNGTSAFNGGLAIANGGLGIVNLNGGTLSTTTLTTPDWSRLKVNGGTLNITGGVSSNAGNLTISGTSGAATVNQNGGGVYFNSTSTVNIGTTASGVATYNLQSGTLVANTFNVGAGGLGFYSQSNGTSVFNQFILTANVGTGAGTATISGGTFTTGLLDVSEQYGSSSFAQLNGTVNVTGSLVLTIAGTKGTYTLLGGTANFTSLNTNAVSIGLGGGNATFSQLGGVSNFSSGWTADGFGSNLGSFFLGSPGVMNASNSLIIGNLGPALFTQSSGTTKVTAGGIYLGYQPGGNGTMNMLGGTLNTPTLRIGYKGTGSVTQIGGAVTVSGGLNLATFASTSGTYNLIGGTLATSSFFLGSDNGSVGVFNHSGGTATFSSSAVIGGLSGSGTGTYGLSNGATVTFNGNVTLGNTGNGTFNETGGSSAFNNGLSIANGAGNGIVNLTGGTLNASTITLNPNGQFNLVSTATNALSYTAFNQTGGTFTASGHEYLPSGAIYTQSGGVHSAGNGGLFIAPTPGGSGTYTLSIGTLTANRIGIGSDDTGTGGAGVFNQNGGTVNVTDGFFGLALAGQNSGSAVYNLTLGSLNVNAVETIGGQNSPGTFNQSGGSHSLSGQLQNLNLGTFNLSAGTFTAGSIQLNTGSTFNYTGGTLKSAGGVTQSGGLFSGTGSAVLYVDSKLGVASYTLSGGQLTATNFEIIGATAGGVGVFTQSGGTNSVVGSIAAVGELTGTGTYNLQAGTFAPNQLELGANGSIGTFNQTGGALTTNTFVVEGNAGVGTLNQSAGTFAVSGTFHLGNTNGSAVNVFNLSGGTLTASIGIAILGGDNGTNHTAINLSGSAVVTTPFITTPDWSRVHLYGGTLNLTTGTSSNSGQLLVGGNGGNATLNQTNSGGVVTLTNNIAVGIDGTGTYNLGAGATLSTTTDEYIGLGGAHVGIGTFNQTGGGHTVSGRVFMGYNPTDSGTFAISGGTLSVGSLGGLSLVVGNSGTGVFNQTGGTVTVSAAMDLAKNSGAQGTYNLNGPGSLTVNGPAIVGNVATATGTFNQSNGASAFNGGLTVGGNGSTVNLSGGTMAASAITLNSGGQIAISGSAVLNTGSITTPDWSHVAFTGGTLNVTGGVSANTGTFNVAGGTGSVATLNVSGGASVTATAMLVGSSGVGIVNVAGGSLTVANALTVSNTSSGTNVSGINLSGGTTTIGGGLNLPNWSRLNFTAGTLNLTGGNNSGAGNIYLSKTGSGLSTLNQSGTAIVGGDNLLMGESVGSTGQYNMSNTGSLSINGDEVVGDLGTGAFVQTGGLNLPTRLGLAYSGGVGTYTLAGGSLSVTNDFNIGRGGAGVYTQTGGFASVAGFYIATLGSASGTMSLSGGQMSSTGVGYVGGWLGGPGGVGTLNVSGSATLTMFGTNGIVVYNTSSGTVNSGINLSGGTTTIGGGVTLPDWNRLTFTGGTLNLTGGVSSNAGTLTVGGGGGAALAIRGGTVAATALVNNGALNQTAGQSTFGSVTGTGNVVLGATAGASARMTVGSINQSALTINATGTLAVASNGAAVTDRIPMLGISPGGRLDLANHALLTSAPATSIAQALANGYDNGAWNGTATAGGTGSITSSSANAAASSDQRSLGYASAADVAAGLVSPTTASQIAAGQTLVMYTTPADFNLDGVTNFNDFLALQNHYNQPGDWTMGDANYDGVVNFNDFLLLQNNYNHQLPAGSPAAGEAAGAVPEPGGAALLMLAGVAGIGRRRRRGTP